MGHREDNINEIIRTANIQAGLISDGYHTFDELYEHRIVIYMALCKQLYRESQFNYPNPVWMSSKHSDMSVWKGWFLLGINTQKEEQITYHLPIKYWDECLEFATELDKAPDFDGHTSADVIKRLQNL